MIWLLLIPLIILWAYCAKHGTGQSRGSLRRQRREARKLGIDPGNLIIRHRGQPLDGDPEWLRWTKHPAAWLLPAFLWFLILGDPLFRWLGRHF